MEKLESLIQKWADAERSYLKIIISHRMGSVEELKALRELEDARQAVLVLCPVKEDVDETESYDDLVIELRS